MSAPTLSQFTSELRTRNIARTNQYYIEIVWPKFFQEQITGFSTSDTNLVSMWCHTAMTPQTNILTNDDYLEAGTRRKYAYDQDHQNLTLSFYVDQQFEVKRFFDQWKHAIVPQRRNFNYPEEYTAESLCIYLLDSEGNATYKYEYSKIFPKSINTLELSYASSTSPASFSVDFVFEEVYYSSIVNDSIVFTSKPNSVISTKPKIDNIEVKQSLEDSSWRGRGENGTRWTDSTNGIKGVLPY